MLRKALFIVVGIVALIAGIYLSASKQAPDASSLNEVLENAFVFPVQKSVADFNFIDHRKQAFSKKDLQGKWTLMFFGFTSCPDICPTTLQVLSSSYKQLDETLKDHLQVVLVSVDPERDKASLLAEYIQYFDPNFTALETNETDLRKLTQSLGVSFMKVPLDPNDPSNYTIDHTARIFILDPEGRRFAMLKPELVDGLHVFKSTTLVHDLSLILPEKS